MCVCIWCVILLRALCVVKKIAKTITQLIITRRFLRCLPTITYIVTKKYCITTVYHLAIVLCRYTNDRRHLSVSDSVTAPYTSARVIKLVKTKRNQLKLTFVLYFLSFSHFPHPKTPLCWPNCCVECCV